MQTASSITAHDPQQSRSDRLKRIDRWCSIPLFETRAHQLIITYFVVSALSIGVSQAALISLLIYWFLVLYANRTKLPAHVSSFWQANKIVYLASPIAYWALISLFSALVGIYPLKSVAAFFKTSIYLLLPFCIAFVMLLRARSDEAFLSDLKNYVCAFLFGHSLAALARLISEASNNSLTFGTPGAVTQSGQLVLIMPLLLALSFLHRRSLALPSTSDPAFIRAAATFVLLVSLAWAPAAYSLIIVLILAFLYAKQVFAIITGPARILAFTILFSAPLLFSSFVINLKRGPWLAVFIECLLVGTMISRRMLLSTFAFAILALSLIPPVRDRALSFVADFEIAGGRKTMWSMGLELAESYPLGLGPNNARFIRELDPTLPQLHRHLHNNLLNIAAETGWIGVMIFAWWFYRLMVLGFSNWNRFGRTAREVDYSRHLTANVGLAITLSLIGWQIAGLVEYNFGDGEVRLIALSLMGLLLAIAERSHSLR